MAQGQEVYLVVPKLDVIDSLSIITKEVCDPADKKVKHTGIG